MTNETLRMQMLAGVITEGQYKAKLEENAAPIHNVVTMDGKTMVGTYQYGVGFKANEKGIEMGFEDNPKEIPNKTKIVKNDKVMGDAVKIKYGGPFVEESLNESMIGGIVGIGAINQIPPRAKADYETAFEHFLGGKYGLNEIEGGGMIDFVKQNFDTIKDNFYKAEKDIIINHTDFEDGEDPSTFINFLDNQINNVSTAKDLIDVINDRSIGVDLEGEEASELFDMIKGYASLEEGKEVEEPTNY